MNYSNELKNFYWDIMISPKCIPLQDMLAVHHSFGAIRRHLNSQERFSEGYKVCEKMTEVAYNMADFIEENIDLEKYGLGLYDENLYSRHCLALALISMYNDDI